MPINTRELMDAVGILADRESMRVTVASSATGAAVCAGLCFVGGLLGGPKGLAIGGTAGALTAAYMNWGQFRPVSDIIMNEMSHHERESLKNHIAAALADFQISDVAMLLPLLMNESAAANVVLDTVANFIRSDMNLQIID
ncbi:protein C19orf12 homolog [Armigeres subalbatus]|uniref:protein C19orf12 homolog n=1 Tax=Armigeres subalbatus TaxID=124917 RepID=UPI002ED2E567